MLEVARMTQGNRYTHAISLDNGLIYSEWGCEIFFLSLEGSLAKNSQEALE